MRVPVRLVLVIVVAACSVAACGSSSAVGQLSAHAAASSTKPVAADSAHAARATVKPTAAPQPTGLSDSSTSTIGNLSVTVRNCSVELMTVPGYGSIKLFSADLTVENSGTSPIYSSSNYHILIGPGASAGLLQDGQLPIPVSPGSTSMHIVGPDPNTYGVTAALQSQPAGPVVCTIQLQPVGG